MSDTRHIKSNYETQTDSNIMAASMFARQVLSRVGGSLVYIEPKKVDRKFVDFEK